MIEMRIDVPGRTLPWHCACHRFDTPDLAYAAFVRVHEAHPDGRLGLGIYRHQRLGLDSEAVLVSVVGLDKRDEVSEAERILGGEEIQLHPENWLMLIKRRAEVVLELGKEGFQPGRYRIVHENGMRIDAHD